MTKPKIHDMTDKVSKLDLSLSPDFGFPGTLAPQVLTALGLLGIPCLRTLYPGFALPVHASDTGSIITASGKPSLTYPYAFSHRDSVSHFPVFAVIVIW